MHAPTDRDSVTEEAPPRHRRSAGGSDRNALRIVPNVHGQTMPHASTDYRNLSFQNRRAQASAQKSHCIHQKKSHCCHKKKATAYRRRIGRQADPSTCPLLPRELQYRGALPTERIRCSMQSSDPAHNVHTGRQRPFIIYGPLNLFPVSAASRR